jgi:hypothetical protein
MDSFELSHSGVSETGVSKTPTNTIIINVLNNIVGLMPRTTTTTVSQNSEGQYQVTIPKSVGDYHDLAGKKLEWKRGPAKDKILVVIQDDE